MQRQSPTPSCHETAGHFLSAEEIERTRRILEQARRAYHPAELPAHLLNAMVEMAGGGKPSCGG